MIYKNIALILFSMTSLAAVSFTELTDTSSALWQKTESMTYAERTQYVCDSAKKTGENTFVVSITDVPTKFCTTTTVSVHITQSDAWFDVEAFDESGEMIFEGTWSEAEATLDMLLGLHPRVVTGSCSLQLWDALWQLCGIRSGTLEDASSVDEFKLRYLRPYTQGSSLFTAHGYQSRRYSRAEYDTAVTQLQQRPCYSIKKYLALDDCCVLSEMLDFCGRDATTTIGDLVRIIERYARSVSTHQKQYHAWLVFLYTHVIKNKTFDPTTEQYLPIIAHPDLEKPNRLRC